MFIDTIHKNDNGNLIVCDITRNGGIFLEILENEVPKKNRTENLGGCGVDTGDKYFRSNTAGETNKKYFKKVSNRIKFYPKKYYDELRENKNISVENTFKYFDEYLKNNKFAKISISEQSKFIGVKLTMDINKKDLIPENNKYIKYCESFRKCINYSISLLVLIHNTKEGIEKIKKIFNLENLCLEKKIEVKEIQEYINKLKLINENGKLRIWDHEVY